MGEVKNGDIVRELRTGIAGEAFAERLDILVCAVQRMRNAQRDWFGGDKSRAKLQEARTLERNVDKMLETLIAVPPKQGGLF